MSEREEHQDVSEDLVEEEGVNAGSGVAEPAEGGDRADVRAGGHPEDAPARAGAEPPEELVGASDDEQGQQRSIGTG